MLLEGIDYLMKKNKKAEIKSRGKSLLKEAYQIRKSQLPKSIDLASEALELGKKTEDNKLIARSYNALALYHMITGENNTCKDYSNRALHLFTELDNEIGIADTKFVIASAHYKTNNFSEGLKNFFECLQVYEKQNDFAKMAQVNKSLGLLYENIGDKENAKKSYEVCINLAKKSDQPDLISNGYNAISGLLADEGNGERALNLAKLAYDIKTKTGDSRGIAFSILSMAKALEALGKHDEAEEKYHESLRAQKHHQDKIGIGTVLYHLGKFYSKKNELENAKKYFGEGEEVAEKYQLATLCYDIYYCQYLIAKKENNTEEKLKHLERYLEAKETSLQQHTGKVIQSYQMMCQMTKMQNEAKVHREKLELEEKKNIELDSFFYRISHDLKGPITSMMSLGYIAKMDVKDQKALKYFEDYETQTTRLNNIVDELLNLTKISFSSENKKKIDFEKIVYDCLGSYKYLENYKKIKFNIDIQPEIEYQAEWSLINTIIQNLIENGIKYARIEENNPKLDISIHENQNQSINITVIDNGIGMDEETQEKIFTMFYRVNRNIQGSGIGLHILQRAVDKMQGHIELKSKLNEGSSFTITLPPNIKMPRF